MLQISYNKIRALDVAEEIVQDAFIGFYKQKAIITGNPFDYLKGILRHKVLDYFRNNKNKIILSVYNEQLLPEMSDNDTLHRITGREAEYKINTYIEKLPEQCRRVYLMSREEDLSNKEIADRLGISVKAVEAHITRALKFLREHIDHHWAWITVVLGIDLLK